MQDDIFAQNAERSIDIEIRYEGQYAQQGAIPMTALAESLEGFGRIYAVVGHFVSTGEYALQLQALNAKVLVSKQEEKCFSIGGALSWVSSNGLFSGFAGAVVTAVVAVVYNRSRGSQEEMKHLRDLFEKKLDIDATTTQRLLDTVDRLAGALQPAAKKSLSPIGEACDRIELYAAGQKNQDLSMIDKEALLSIDADQVKEEKTYSIIISEFDKLKRTCKASFADSAAVLDESDSGPDRIPCEITDPAAMLSDNRYIEAFSSGKSLEVRAKALIKNGVITKLYISDTV